MSYFIKGTEHAQRKRDHLASRLASIRDGRSEPSHGMTKDEAITLLIQDIADHNDILARLQSHNRS